MAKRRSMKDRVKDRAKEREQEGGGKAQWLNVEEDVEFLEVAADKKKKAVTLEFSILPYEVTVDTHPEVEAGELWYQRTVWVHYDVGAEKKAYACPLKTLKRKCPICEHRAELLRDQDADEDTLKALLPREREVFNVMEAGEDEIKLFTTSFHLFGKQLEREIRESTDEWAAAFADLEGGSDLRVRFAKEKLGRNEFYQADRIDFLERDDLPESILDDVFNLDEILRVLDYEDLKARFYELEEPEDKTSRGRKSGGSRRTTRGRKEEDGGDDDKPSRGRRSSGREEKKEDKPTRGRRSSGRGRRSSRKEEDTPKDKEGEDKPSRGRSGRRSSGRRNKPEEKEEKPSRGRGRGRSSSRKPKDEPKDEGGSGDTCPFDHRFGHDCNEFNDCDNCDSWEDCVEEKDRLEAAR